MPGEDKALDAFQVGERLGNLAGLVSGLQSTVEAMRQEATAGRGKPHERVNELAEELAPLPHQNEAIMGELASLTAAVEDMAPVVRDHARMLPDHAERIKALEFKVGAHEAGLAQSRWLGRGILIGLGATGGAGAVGVVAKFWDRIVAALRIG